MILSRILIRILIAAGFFCCLSLPLAAQTYVCNVKDNYGTDLIPDQIRFDVKAESVRVDGFIPNFDDDFVYTTRDMSDTAAKTKFVWATDNYNWASVKKTNLVKGFAKVESAIEYDAILFKSKKRLSVKFRPGGLERVVRFGGTCSRTK